MKRYILVFISIFISLVAMAKPLKLNLDKLFDGSFNSNKNVTIQISKSKDNYFRAFSVLDGNPALVKKVTELYRKDEKNADSSQDFIGDGRVTFIRMQIVNNDQPVDIGLSFTPNNGCYLYIKGPAAAFK
ncbi:MAG: hypothetical protein HDS31_08315 [Bacteroides sp.]|nr:hypothetical protein [Bacteroides sp.]